MFCFYMLCVHTTTLSFSPSQIRDKSKATVHILEISGSAAKNAEAAQAAASVAGGTALSGNPLDTANPSDVYLLNERTVRYVSVKGSSLYRCVRNENI